MGATSVNVFAQATPAVAAMAKDSKIGKARIDARARIKGP
jgi:hypothetical protein